MPAYWVARSRIIDPVEYKKYTDRIPAIFAKYGRRALARGGRFQVMEGTDRFHRFVVVEFDTFEQGVACFESPEYDEAAAFRRNGAGAIGAPPAPSSRQRRAASCWRRVCGSWPIRRPTSRGSRPSSG